MEEITPDIVARIASRIYNESSHAPSGGHAPSMVNPSSVPHPPIEAPYGGANPHNMVSSAATGSVPSSPAAYSPVGNPAPFPQAAPNHSPVYTHPSSAGGVSVPVQQHGATQHYSSSSPHHYSSAASYPRNDYHPTNAPPVGSPNTLHSNEHGSHFQDHGSPLGTHPPMDLVPGRSGNSQGISNDGLRSFVQRIRSHNYTDRQQCQTHNESDNLLHRLNLNRVVPSNGPRSMDIAAIRKDFPILRQQIHGKPLAWFDNAATTQKPQSVIDAISNFYENDNSNIHRAAHTLAARSTDAYEKARTKVQAFLGASSVKEIVFVRGTTEGINLIAKTYGKKFLQPGDEIVLSSLEHHASIVPWQMIAKEQGAVLRVIPVNDHGEIMMEEYQKLLSHRTKVVAVTHTSNSLGTVLPIGDITQIAKRYGARVVIDAAQSVAHAPINVQQLGCDFCVFSGHKIYGPTGIGAVFIKEEIHDILPPWQGGGNMIRNVTFEETSFSDAPAKFEAGTPNVADAVGLGAALDYVNSLGLSNIAAYEHELLEYATEHMSRINGLRIIGTAKEKVGILSFVLSNFRNEDVGRLLDQEGIAVRVGHHCSQPSLRRFGLESTIRPSFSFYNTRSEIDRMVDTVKNINRMPVHHNHFR